MSLSNRIEQVKHSTRVIGLDRQPRQADPAVRYDQERPPGQRRTPSIRRFDVVLSGLGLALANRG